MKILVACEFSQIVTQAFRDKGHEAYSCDLLPTEGNPNWHIQQDVLALPVFRRNSLDLEIMNQRPEWCWDLMIAHPPCQYLSNAGARWLYPKGKLNKKRYEKGLKAKIFFMQLLCAKIKHVAIENPLPLKIYNLPKYTQVIQPYEYGHNFSKRTLLWLKNLPELKPTNIVENKYHYLPCNTGLGRRLGRKYEFRSISKKDSQRTFKGIAEAMANQWG